MSNDRIVLVVSLTIIVFVVAWVLGAAVANLFA
jgi:hypothetical protein